MDLQQCSDCKVNYPQWMIICMDATSMCKICILSGQIKANKDRIEEVKLDIDIITGKINETTTYADDTESMRKEMKLIEEKVKNIEKVELDFSGFVRPDFIKVSKEQKEEEESRDDERDDWEMLKDDVGNMITSGIKEIREGIYDKGGNEGNLRGSFSQSSEIRIERAKKGNCNNRYCLLEEDNGERKEEKEYEILGNSEVRYMRERTKRGGRRGIYSTNGAGIEDILEHIRNKRMEGKTTVIHGGGDDIKKLETEHMLRVYKDAIKETIDQGKLCIVSGIVPRRGESSYWSSRAIGINNRLQGYCKEMDGVMFIDNWDRFYGNRKLYSADGMNLSRLGTSLLSVIIEEKVQINSNLDKRRRREIIT